MYFVTRLFIAVTLVSLGACGNDSRNGMSEEGGAEQLSAATLGEQTVLDVSEYLAIEQFKVANVKKGERQALICKGCAGRICLLAGDAGRRFCMDAESAGCVVGTTGPLFARQQDDFWWCGKPAGQG